MNLHLPVRPRKHGSVLNESAAWKDRAEKAEARAERAEDSVTDLLAENGVQASLIETLERQLAVAADATSGLRRALDAAAQKATPTPVDPELQKELAKAREQIARQEASIRSYETDHQQLNDALRTVAEERNAALATVERMSREGAWTPEGVA